MIRKYTKKLTAIVLVLVMMFSNVIFAQDMDLKGHWAEESIQSWVDKGYVKGYPDGSFKPENQITRAEFVSLVNRVFEFTDTKTVNYKDIDKSHWAYDEFQRASAKGYLVGYEDGSFRPNNSISRQEVAAIIARLLTLEENKTRQEFLNLEDLKEIPEWSAGVISAVMSKGYMKLRDKSFAPALPATRAEVVSALDKGYLNFVKIEYKKAGTYAPGLVDGSVEVNGADLILENTTINGNLLIGEVVGGGDVTLDNIVVKGDTIVQGGGMDTIIIKDSDIPNLIVEKKDGKVRVLAKGKTYIKKTIIKSGGKLESENKDASHFGDLEIADNIISKEPIILKANFENIEIKSGTNPVQVEGGTIKKLVINERAKGVNINLGEDVKVDKMEINAKATIQGEGKIGTAQINAQDVNIKVKTDKEAEGEKVDTTETGGGSGSGGSSGSTGVIESPEADFDFNKMTGTIESYVGTDKDIVIPAKIANVPVKIIGIYAFQNMDLKTIIIPNTVISIEKDAFSNNELTSVKIGDSVKNIGPGAFNNNQLADKDAFIYGRNSDGSEDKTTLVSYGGAKRDHVKTPKSVTSIGEFAFSMQGISSIIIDDSVITIGKGAFSDNPLTSVNIPNSVITIGKYAFSDCEISSVVIGESVVTIDDYAFQYNDLNSVKLPSSVLDIGKGAFSLNGSSNTSDNIEEKPYEGNWVLKDNKWINQDIRYQVILEGDAAKETDYTITGADDLTKVERETNLTITAVNDIIVNGEKMTKDESKIININNDITITINIFKEIPVTGITLDKEELELGINEGNRKLIATITPEEATNKDVTWTSSNESIATVNKGVVTPVTKGTTTITVSIGDLKATCVVKVVEGAPPTPEDQFEFDASTGTIKKLKASYTKKDIVIPAKIDGTVVEIIGESAFKERYIKTVIIPNTVIEIKDYAFDTNHLTSVIMPDKLEKIGRNAFHENKLTSVNIPDTVTDIGAVAFSKNQLTSIKIPNKVTVINPSSFSWNLLTSVDIHDSVTNIYHTAFHNNKLTEVTIPESVKTIGVSAFSKNGTSSDSDNIDAEPYPGTWKLSGKKWIKQ